VKCHYCGTEVETTRRGGGWTVDCPNANLLVSAMNNTSFCEVSHALGMINKYVMHQSEQKAINSYKRNRIMITVDKIRAKYFFWQHRKRKWL